MINYDKYQLYKSVCSIIKTFDE